MKPTDPLELRCLALTGSFETGKLSPGCFSSLVGDFDGQGLSFSALQWNIGQGTLQPLLQQMLDKHPEVMAKAFAPLLFDRLKGMLNAVTARYQQLGWARGIQGSHNHRIEPDWLAAFMNLGANPEWQSVAQVSAAGYFDHAKMQAVTFNVKSDRALALLFDCAVQNGGVSNLATHKVLDSFQLGWGEGGDREAQILRAIAGAVADSCNPRFRQDVLSRKMCIAEGIGVVHGVHYDLGADFALS